MFTGDLEGKVLALLVSAKAADGAEETVVIAGTVRLEGGRAYLDRGQAHDRLYIRDDWCRREAGCKRCEEAGPAF